ncbi:histidine kinase [Citricoccus nitrophenolicus]
MNEREPSARLSAGQFPATVAGPDATGRGISRSERSVATTWWYTFISMGIFAVFTSLAIVAVQSAFVRNSGGTRTLALTLADILTLAGAVTAVYGCYLLRHGTGRERPGTRSILLIGIPPAVVWVLTLWIPGAAFTGTFPLWIAVNVLAPLFRGRARHLLLIAGVILFGVHWWAGGLLTGVEGMGHDEEQVLFSLVFVVVMCPVMFLFSAWWWNIVVHLNDARRDAAQLAVARERLRFASDLHDIQGHHLQVIALKAELAERLMGAGRPEAAAENIHEVRTIARTALEETRSLVRNLREVSLEEEIANAKDVLNASGAAVTIRGILVEDPAVRTLLGLAVREGATNILRHAAAATRVSITLEDADGGLRLVMVNDGVEAPDDDGGEGAGAPSGTLVVGAGGPASGTGLSGLNRRFASSGGSVTGRYDDGAFVLEARLPAVPGRGHLESSTVLPKEPTP